MKQSFKAALRRMALLAAALPILSGTALAQYHSLNFEDYNPGNDVKITGETIMSIIKGNPEVVKNIPVCVGVVKNDRPNYSNTASHKGICIESSPNMTGEISFEINPAYSVVPKTFNIFAYPDEDLISSTATELSVIEISVNDGAFESAQIDKIRNFCAITATWNEPIRKFTVRIPYVHIGADISGSNKYDVVIGKINIAYDTPVKSALEKWEYSAATHMGYLDEEYEMPLLLALPSFAAEMAVHSSSNPEVADFENGKLVLKKNGNTTISSSLGENLLYHPGALGNAEYTLTVNDSRGGMTVVEAPTESDYKTYVIYDLSGRIVTSEPDPGIYIRRHGDKVEKILIK